MADIEMTDAPEDWGTTDVVFYTETQHSGTQAIPLSGKYRSLTIMARNISPGTVVLKGDLEVQHLNIAAETGLLGTVHINGSMRIGTLSVSSLLELRGQTRVTGDVSIGHIHVFPRGMLRLAGGLVVDRVYIDRFDVDVDGEVEFTSRISAPSGFVIDKLNNNGSFATTSTAFTVNNHTGQPIVYG